MNKKHGKKGSPVYAVWRQMLTRCTNPKFIQYADYGGRGISVCERWRCFENFGDYALLDRDSNRRQSAKRQAGFLLKRPFVGAALAVVISVWSELAIALVPIAEVRLPPGIVDVAVGHSADDIGLRSEFVFRSHFDLRLVRLVGVQHLFVNKGLCDSIPLPEWRGAVCRLTSDGHTVSWRLPVISNANAKVVEVNLVDLQQVGAFVGHDVRHNSRLRVEKDVIQRDVGTQFFARLFSTIAIQADSENGNYQSKDRDKRVRDLEALPEGYISLWGLLTCFACVIAAFILWGRGGVFVGLSVFLLFEATVGLLLGWDLWSIGVRLWSPM